MGSPKADVGHTADGSVTGKTDADGSVENQSPQTTTGSENSRGQEFEPEGKLCQIRKRNVHVRARTISCFHSAEIKYVSTMFALIMTVQMEIGKRKLMVDLRTSLL